MQDVAPGHCAATNVGEVFNLVDNRGATKYSYLVGKLADGRCWMLQNLALPGGTVLTPADSNVTSNYTLPASNNSGWTSDTAQYMWNGTHIDNTDDTAVTTAGTATNNTGAYYSFLVATANTGTGSSGDAGSSICPKGWRLPKGNNGEFQTLYTAYSSNQSQLQTALHRAATGGCNSSNCPNQHSGAYSAYWSSTINSGTSGYYLGLYADSINPANNISKSLGFSIRCILNS